MRRREFIIVLGGAAVAWPLAASAQTSRHLGILSATGAQSAGTRGLFEAFDQELKEHGWIEGQNVSSRRQLTRHAMPRIPYQSLWRQLSIRLQPVLSRA